jgi:cytochrome bd ubiquinol oxidase subunit I
VLFALPDQANATNRYEIAIPLLVSVILTHSLDGQIKGLKDFPAEDRPPVAVVFWAFRVMVGLGVLMAALGLVSLVLRRGGRIYTNRWLQRCTVVMGPVGFISILAGWTVTEVGRQPFTVYGLLRTADSASPIDLPGMATSLAAFAVVYLLVFGSGVAFLLAMVAKPPVVGEEGPSAHQPMHSAGLTPGPVSHGAGSSSHPAE